LSVVYSLHADVTHSRCCISAFLILAFDCSTYCSVLQLKHAQYPLVLTDLHSLGPATRVLVARHCAYLHSETRPRLGYALPVDVECAASRLGTGSPSPTALALAWPQRGIVSQGHGKPYDGME
jgi:hypothetical protein